MTERANWREGAACRTADPELFFPVGRTGPALLQIDQAKRICRTCPAQPQCLAWALRHQVTDGVWGGTTEDERRTLRPDYPRDSYPRTMTMAQNIADQNTEYVRRLLRVKQPAFAIALELAAALVEQELLGWRRAAAPAALG